MEFIAKDTGFLARRLKKTEYDKEPDKFKSNCAEASYFFNGFRIASAAFNKMVKKLQEDPECRESALDFMMDEIVELKKLELKGEKNDKS
jgi:hypothetical protein